MSRCFPFPPPGYEAKPRSEHNDLLKKGKHKEKKHKKESKERRGRERKEKNSDRRKDKHSKKHKREKHKDKRKNKDDDRYTNQTLEKATLRNADLDNGRLKEKIQHEAVKDIKPANELVTQILDQEGHANHTSSSTGKLLPSTKSFGSAGSKGKKRSLSSVIEKSRQPTHLNHEMIEKKYSVAYDCASLGSKPRLQNGRSLQVGSAEKHSNTNRKHSHNRMDRPQRNTEGTSTITTVVSGAERAPNGVVTPSPNSLLRTEQVGQDPVVSSHFPSRNSDSMSPRGLMEIRNGNNSDFQIRMDRQSVRSKAGAVKRKGKTKELKSNDHKYVEDKDRDRLANERKTKDRIEEKEKVGKVVVSKQERKELDSLGASKNKIDGLQRQLGQLNEEFTSDDVKKRKDAEANSSLLVAEHSMRMNKLPRISPTDPRTNGEILDYSQGSGPSSPVGTNTYKADRFQDSKECYNNGVTGSHHLKEPKTSVSSSNHGSSQVSPKLPHPDAKYLGQVYSIPAMDDWSKCIDQSWLLSRGSVDWKSEILEAAESPRVWAEARLIDSADVVALPYVVPL
ncbi:uncharacterized protein LOC127782260 [Oryza glaberrima]|uniref:Uncharacterized protein n=1 Tax=Oryza glaberrima TaxID=4538 RepID=I1QL13_ORYGL|nr:uncharacterized protein LOC127782260 [Oryza glaberrima]